MRLSRRRWLGHGAAWLALPALGPAARSADATTDPFALGIASGSPTSASVVLWTRLVGDALPDTVNVDWEVADDERFERVVARGSESAVAADAHSVHAEAGGLAPGRWYWYRFTARGPLRARSAVGRTRTAPAPDADASLSAVLASCQRWDHGHWAAWRDAVAASPDLVLFVGDYIYEYGAVPGTVRAHRGGAVRTLAAYRDRHAQYKSDPLLQAAHAACPWLLVWDDHEVDNDYAGVVGQDLQPDFGAQRAAAYRAYWEHMPLPKAARPQGDQGGAMTMHGRLDWGRLARLHLLDTRQHRDLQACPRPQRAGSNTVRRRDCPSLADPARTMLGAAQEAWLADGWDVERPWNLVVQSTLMANWSWSDPSAPDGGLVWTDGWSGYPEARRRLLQPAAERKLGGVVVLGGDVHTHYVADLRVDDDNPRAPVVASEFCGTSISSRPLAQERIDAALRFNPHVACARGDKRGSVRLAIDGPRLRAELRIVDDAADPGSVARTDVAFVVEHGRPGAQRE